MADSFQQALYAVIERHKHCSSKDLEHFIALGDKALVVGDLGLEKNLAFYLDDIQKLLKSYGVLPPVEQGVGPFWWLWPDSCLVYRDFTVGELAELARTGIWPPDAYVLEKNSLTQKLMSLLVILVLGGLVLGILALLGFWLGRYLR